MGVDYICFADYIDYWVLDDFKFDVDNIEDVEGDQIVEEILFAEVPDKHLILVVALFQEEDYIIVVSYAFAEVPEHTLTRRPGYWAELVYVKHFL